MAWRCSACQGENPDGTRFCGQCGTPRDEAQAEREDAAAEALKSFVSAQVADKIAASGGELKEERRLVTALFADLSGFTGLADRLDPEQLLEVIDPIIESMTNIVGRYEGYVDKFAGDALLAFFGAPVAHEDDAHRALMVATEMHHELADLAQKLPPEAGELTLHIGVNSGRVVARVLGTDVRMDYAVLGDAVILAQRLESAAPAGETYVGEETYQITRDRFAFESVGELTLKGKAEAVAAWRLIGEKRRARGLSRLVGRDSELDNVKAALEMLSTGSGVVVSVSGEPGVGKSRFTAEIQAVADERGYRWLEARCLAYGSGIAYWPYAEMIRKLAGIDPRDQPDRALPRLAAILEAMELGSAIPFFARMIGLPAPEIESFDPESYRRELVGIFGELFKWLASERPTILALEDLQWADASSIALTTELARLTATDPIAIYVTARSEAMAVLLEVAAVADEGNRHAVQLDPLDAPATAPILEDLLGARCNADLVEAVNERAVGNPFFTNELARALLEAEGIEKGDDGWSLSPGFDLSAIPPTIEGVLASRIDKLSAGAASTLQIASVIGRRVRLPLLRGVVDPGRDVDAELSELIEAGFVDDSGTEIDTRDYELVFHHALMQDVAYSRLLRKDRRKLHLKVAEVAEDLYGADDDTIDLLARHLHLGEGGAKAVDYLVRAGYRAANLFANDEALIHLLHALELAEKHAPERRGPVLLKIADLNELRGDYATALARYTEARDITGSVLAWRGMASALRNLSEYEAALRLLDDAFAAIHENAELPLLWLERGWVLARQGRFPDAISTLQKGLAVSPGSSWHVMGELLVQLTRAETVVGHVEDALTHAEQAMEIFEALDDLPGLVSAYRVSMDPYLALDRVDEAADKLKRGIQIAEQIGAAQELGACHINLGLVELKRGALVEAIACDERAIEVYERIGFATGQAFGYGNLAEKLLYAGRHMEALDTAGKALDLARAIGDLETVADVTKTVAAARHIQGHLSEAAATAEEAAELYLEIGAVPTAVQALEMAVEFHTEAGDEERARAISARAHLMAATTD